MADFGTANAGILAQTYLQKQELRQDALLRGGALMLQASDSYRRNKREDAESVRRDKDETRRDKEEARRQDEYEYGKSQRGTEEAAKKSEEDRKATEEMRKQSEFDLKFKPQSIDDDNDPKTPNIEISPAQDLAAQSVIRSRLETKRMQNAMSADTMITSLFLGMRDASGSSQDRPYVIDEDVVNSSEAQVLPYPGEPFTVAGDATGAVGEINRYKARKDIEDFLAR